MDDQDKIQLIFKLGRVCRTCLQIKPSAECRILLPSQRCKDCGMKDPRRRNTTARNRRRRMQREQEATLVVAASDAGFSETRVMQPEQKATLIVAEGTVGVTKSGND